VVVLFIRKNSISLGVNANLRPYKRKRENDWGGGGGGGEYMKPRHVFFIIRNLESPQRIEVSSFYKFKLILFPEQFREGWG